MSVAYVNYGPAMKRVRGHAPMVTARWRNRPYCELCGPFRGAWLRVSGWDEFGALHRCERCDGEDS